jgi:hypothetical protein
MVDLSKSRRLASLISHLQGTKAMFLKKCDSSKYYNVFVLSISDKSKTFQNIIIRGQYDKTFLL